MITKIIQLIVFVTVAIIGENILTSYMNIDLTATQATVYRFYNCLVGGGVVAILLCKK